MQLKSEGVGNEKMQKHENDAKKSTKRNLNPQAGSSLKSGGAAAEARPFMNAEIGKNRGGGSRFQWRIRMEQFVSLKSDGKKHAKRGKKAGSTPQISVRKSRGAICATEIRGGWQ